MPFVKFLLSIICFPLIATMSAAQQTLPVIPYPQEVVYGKGILTLSNKATIGYNNPQLAGMAELLKMGLGNGQSLLLQVIKSQQAPENGISLQLISDPTLQEEGYRLVVSSNGILISGNTAAGVFYGTQTLLQMMTPDKKLQALSIKDEPRFSYRGMMLDVARHFQPVSYVKQLLDQLAMLKINRFHWHLTEDQGWRIEIKKYPKLTEKGAWRNGTIVGHHPGTGNTNERYGGFYTQEEVKEVVQYAAARFITVIPEIEMPGHSGAAIAAYPWLSCFPNEATIVPHHPSLQTMREAGKQVQESWGVYEDVYVPSEQTFQFLQDVIDEIIPLFPSPYIHIGGDECPKESWKRSEFCQQLIKEKGLKDEHGLQSYFISRMEQYINSKGKKIIGWDEILEGGLAPNATVMSWRGENGGIEAAQQHHDVIMTPTSNCYFDYSQTKNEDSLVIGGFLPLEQVYGYEPVPEALSDKPEAKYVLGTQANVWTEYIPNNRKLEYMLYPRLAALAEVAWTEKKAKNWHRFQSQIPSFLQRLDKAGIHYSKAFYELSAEIKPIPSGAGVVWHLDSKQPDANIVVTTPSGSKKIYTTPVPINATGKWVASLEQRGKILSTIKQDFELHKAVGKTVAVHPLPARKYSGNNGANGLVNGASSNNGLISAEWLGWEGKDMEATIDLGEVQTINQVVLHTMEAQGSWIYRPAEISISTSNDGVQYQKVTMVKGDAIPGGNDLRKVVLGTLGTEARFVKIYVKHFGIIPTGMPGAGHSAWIFVDEIAVY